MLERPKYDAQPRAHRWSLGGAVIVLLLAQVGSWLLVAAVGPFFGIQLSDIAEMTPAVLAMGLLIIPVMLGGGTVLLLWRYDAIAFLKHRLVQGNGLRLLVIGLLAGVGVKVLSDVTVLALLHLGVEPEANNPLLQYSHLDFTTGQLAAIAIGITLLVPAAEELFFRGYLYEALRARFSLWPAVLLSGLLFGAVHFNLTLLLPLTIAGLALTVLYEWTGSLVPPILAHMVMNGAAVLATLYLLYY